MLGLVHNLMTVERRAAGPEYRVRLVEHGVMVKDTWLLSEP